MRVWRTIGDWGLKIGDWTAKNTQECGKNDTIFACVIFFSYLCSRKGYKPFLLEVYPADEDT